MWIDNHNGERVDVEKVDTEQLREIRQHTIAAVVGGDTHLVDQLVDIDDELLARTDDEAGRE